MLVRGCVIVLWWLLWHRAGVVMANREEDPAGCGPALEFLVQHNVASQHHLAQLPSKGE